MKDDGAKAKEAELTDIEVDEVSLVDRAANRKRFHVVKRADGTAATEEQDMKVTKERRAALMQAVENMRVRCDHVAKLIEAATDVEKSEDEDTDDVRVQMASICEIAEPLSKKDAEKAPTVAPAGAAAEEENKAAAAKACGGAKDGEAEEDAAKKAKEPECDVDGATPDDVAKEAWDTAYVNALPDDAFLFIEAGGEKDEEKKTKPRSLRHFPYVDDNGDVDLPHLRNAIARIPQSKIPGMTAADREKLQEKARGLLEEAQKTESKKALAEVQKRADEATAHAAAVTRAMMEAVATVQKVALERDAARAKLAGIEAERKAEAERAATRKAAPVAQSQTAAVLGDGAEAAAARVEKRDAWPVAWVGGRPI